MHSLFAPLEVTLVRDLRDEETLFVNTSVLAGNVDIIPMVKVTGTGLCAFC